MWHDQRIIFMLEQLIRLQQELNTYSLETLNEIRHINRELRDLQKQSNRILELLSTPEATFAKLVISDLKGNVLMPATLAVGATATAVLHEFVSQGGAELAPIGPVTYSTSDAAIATVDPNTGLITAVAAGTATITGTDAGNGLSASDLVSDTPVVATVATLVITPN